MTTTRLTRRRLGQLALAATAGLIGTRAAAQDPLSIAAVNYPLAYFAERIAGDLATVNFTVPDDIDPSYWRPGIADIAAIQSSDLILLNGAGFADWTARTTLPRSRTVMTSAAFEDRFIATETITHAHGEGGEHSHTGTANYVWLDFELAKMQAGAIAAAIRRRAPEAEDAIARNLAALAADLDALDAGAQQVGAAAEGIPMIASHPRYQYFARAYGLEIASVEWGRGEPVTPEQLSALEAVVAQSRARVFIWEAAPDEASRAAVESLGLTNVVFPPLANRPTEGDFLSAMSGSLQDLQQGIGAAVGN